MFHDRLAKAFAILGIGDRDVERGLRHADALRGDADAAGLQIGERYAVTLPRLAD